MSTSPPSTQAQMIARLKPGAGYYPCIARDRWYPILRFHEHVDGFILPVPGDGFEGERFVFAVHFEVKHV